LKDVEHPESAKHIRKMNIDFLSKSILNILIFGLFKNLFIKNININSMAVKNKAFPMSTK
tara:strand:+ start:301 stop:480 length:180 start_codon:yes stop_codon:yes gene_type:complete